LCKGNDNKENVNLESNTMNLRTTSVAGTPCRVFFEICQSCNIIKFDPDDDDGRHYGDCRDCVLKRKGRRDQIVKQPLNYAGAAMLQ